MPSIGYRSRKGLRSVMRWRADGRTGAATWTTSEGLGLLLFPTRYRISRSRWPELWQFRYHYTTKRTWAVYYWQVAAN